MRAPSYAGRDPQTGARDASSAASSTTPESPTRGAPEPRQRWRIAFERDPVALDRVGRAAIDEWQASLVSSGMPVAPLTADPGRIRLALGAPLPANAAGCRELVDVWLLDRVPFWQLREAVAPRLPAGHRWVDAEDVWLGGPALPALVAAADWRVSIDAGDEPTVDRERLDRAVSSVLAARTLERTRVKGGTAKRYDLRPLLAGLELALEDDLELLVRTRFDPERGPGRPDEVIAAVADAAGVGLAIRTLTRTRLLLVGDGVD